jgi:hypothetical protein
VKIQFSLPQQAAADRSRRHRIQLINDELPPAFAGLMDFGTTHSWGCGAIALHPGLYSVARIRGLRTRSGDLTQR